MMQDFNLSIGELHLLAKAGRSTQLNGPREALLRENTKNKTILLQCDFFLNNKFFCYFSLIIHVFHFLQKYEVSRQAVD
jgi:hypothetical protein